MTVDGLVDCNNFFVSCERVFRPALEGRPTVVLSSNDGCIVARSDEAKAFGIKMAQPAFQAKELIDRHGIAVISGNLRFYTDMSNRVVQTLAELAPAVEKYSIDECFLDLTGIAEDLTAFCQTVRQTVRQWTGLPVGTGIAKTKTLAKIANRIAKTSAKTNGVLDLTDSPWRNKALAATEVGDVWGIGRQYARKLNRNGVKTALDLAGRPDGWVRREMGVGGLRTVRELRGKDCIGFEDMPQPKQTTTVSRSFVRRRSARIRRFGQCGHGVRHRCGAIHSQDRSSGVLGERVHRDEPLRERHAPCAVQSGGSVARHQQHETHRAGRAGGVEAYLPGGAGLQAGGCDAARPCRGRTGAKLAVRPDRPEGRQADRGVRCDQRSAGAGIDPVRSCRPRGGVAVEQFVPLALLYDPLGGHPGC